MPIQFVDSSPKLWPIEIDIPYSTFTDANQSIIIAGTGVGPGVITNATRIADVMIYKPTAFDANTVEIGHRATAGDRDTIATASEVSAITTGVAKPVNWQVAGKYADLIVSANRGIYARLGAGSVPTVGLLRLVLIVYDVSPKTTI